MSASPATRVAALLGHGQAAAALRACEAALAQAPEDPALLELAGLACQQLGRFEAAVRHYRGVLAQIPAARLALQNLGGCLARLDRLEEACAAQAEFAAQHPELPEAHHNLADALLALGRSAEALTACRQSLALDADFGPALLTQGLALSDAGEFAAAQAAFDAARARAPQAVEDFVRRTESHPGAGAVLDPTSIWLWRRFADLQRCDWGARDAFLARLREACRAPHVHPDRALCFAAQHTPLDAGELHALACRVAHDIEARVPALPPVAAVRRARPLRVGLLSPDIREHLCLRLMLPLLELADRRAVEWTLYALPPDDGSALRGRAKAAAHRLRECAGLHVMHTAAQIRRDGIDILIDAGGYTAGAVLEVAAARPAPVQVQYLGFAGTLGSRRIDYALVDAALAPPGAEMHWSEALVRLPHTHFLYDFREPMPADICTRADYGLPEDAFVLCAFHKGAKIDPESFALWARVLGRVPRAVLWLAAHDARSRAHLEAAAREHGVDPARLRFAPFEARGRYLARLRLADLFIDALWHNGVTTVCDALAAALPVLSVAGPGGLARVASGLLSAAGTPELILAEAKRLPEKVAALAADPPQLAALRARLARRAAPLFDTAGRVRDVEHALQAIWNRACNGLPPASMQIAAPAPDRPRM